MDGRRIRVIGLDGQPDAFAGRKVQQHGNNLVFYHRFGHWQFGAYYNPPDAGPCSGDSPLAGAFLGQENGSLLASSQPLAMRTTASGWWPNPGRERPRFRRSGSRIVGAGQKCSEDFRQAETGRNLELALNVLQGGCGG